MQYGEGGLGLTAWSKIGFIGWLAAMAGLAIDGIWFPRIGGTIIWIAWAGAALGLIGDRIVRLKKQRDKERVV